MSRIDFEPWEPEESVGKLWHALASRLDAPSVHDGARVDLSEVGGRLAVLFRGLGGDASVEIRPVAEEISGHRLSFRRRLATDAERVARASFDGAALRLPESLAAFPLRDVTGETLYMDQVIAVSPDQLRPFVLGPKGQTFLDLYANGAFVLLVHRAELVESGLPD